MIFKEFRKPVQIFLRIHLFLYNLYMKKGKCHFYQKLSTIWPKNGPIHLNFEPKHHSNYFFSKRKSVWFKISNVSTDYPLKFHLSREKSIFVKYHIKTKTAHLKESHKLRKGTCLYFVDAKNRPKSHLQNL